MANPSGQEVSHSVPPSKPTPIIGSLSIPSQSVANPYSSSSFSFDMLPPLSSSVTYDQILPSCLLLLQRSFPHLLLLHLSLLVSSLQGNLGEDSLSEESPPEGILLGENLQEVKGGAVLPSHSSFGFHNFPFSHSSPMSSQGYLSRDGALDLSTRPRVCCYFPIIPQLTHSSLTTPVLPKSFLP